MVAKEGALDYENRKPIFTKGAILAAVRFKQPQVSTLGGRVGMHRAADGKPPLTAHEIERLRAIAAEDRMWKSIEQRNKVTIEHELSVEAFQSITIEVPAEIFDDAKRASAGVPILPLPVFQDERTSIGCDIAPSSFKSVELQEAA